MDVPCPIEDCDGEFDVTAYEDSEGDAGVIGGIHKFINWDINSSTCGHDEDKFSSREQQTFDDYIVSHFDDFDPPWMP